MASGLDAHTTDASLNSLRKILRPSLILTAALKQAELDRCRATMPGVTFCGITGVLTLVVQCLKFAIGAV